MAHLLAMVAPMTTTSTRTKRRTDPSPTICGNCVHDGHCVFQRNAGAPILFCEEHEAKPAMEVVHVTVRPEIVTPSVPGLCGTCDHLKTCALRSKEHITYHCEHYR